jgi:hypothetical protein
MNKKVLLVGAMALGFMYMQGQKKDSSCQGGSYVVDSSNVCEEDLNTQGYYFWQSGPNGSGYYNLATNFSNAYNLALEDFNRILIDAMANTMNLGSPMYVTSQNTLNQFVKAGAFPLQLA